MSQPEPDPGVNDPASSRVRLVLLGTAGGPTPKADRAAPASAVVAGGAVYVVDCGNGVGRQLVRAGLDLARLTAVFVTHHHVDHDADLGALLHLAWAGPLDRAVDVVAPPPARAMLEAFLEFSRCDVEIRILDEGRPPLAPLVRVREVVEPGVVFEDERVLVLASRVRHPPVEPALAYRFETSGGSIVFSGDTAPCDGIRRLAEGADVLVHEAMYEPALERLAASEPNAPRLLEHLRSSHTSCEDLGRLAATAGVRRLVLTHLVPGDVPDEAWRTAVASTFAGEVVVGHDLLEIEL